MIAAAVPTVGLGNTAPAIFPEDVVLHQGTVVDFSP